MEALYPVSLIEENFIRTLYLYPPLLRPKFGFLSIELWVTAVEMDACGTVSQQSPNSGFLLNIVGDNNNNNMMMLWFLQ